MAVYPQSVLSPDPLWLQTKSYDARSLRKPFSDLLAQGVEDAASFAVSINSGLQMSISAGTAYVKGDNVADQGMYRQYTTAAVLVTTGAHHATLPRLDQVILRVLDNTHDSSTFNEARIEIVPGTATSGATLDNRNGAANLATLGEASKSVLHLADILVPATTGAVTLRDKRKIARLAIQGGTPCGVSIEFNGSGTPAGGYLPEDGSAVSRFTYNELFGEIGVLWGAGDASTTFNVPDKRGRVSVCKGTHTDHDVVGETDGLAVGSRRIRHKHTVVNPTIVNAANAGHIHGGTTDGPNSTNNSTFDNPSGLTTHADTVHTHTFTTGGPSGGTAASATGGTVGPQTGSEPTDGAAFATVAKWIKY